MDSNCSLMSQSLERRNVVEVKVLIDQYGRQKAEANKMYADYKNFLVEVEHTRKLLQAELESSGLRSAKSKDYSVSTVTRPVIEITNEQQAINWLKDMPNIEYDLYIGLKTTSFKKLALELLKQTGEVIEGTEYSTNESITVKDNK